MNSQTGIGGADFDETMTDQLGDLAAGVADPVAHGDGVHQAGEAVIRARLRRLDGRRRMT
jgi:hypothetical protein